ncbi:hypothetical protein JXB12_11325 [candidate division KSB1 bacterium]|nr:hypothetical protein [candidate division KSB1 bacterium]
MTYELSTDDLHQLVKSVFPLSSVDRNLAILVDLPDSEDEDTTDWKNRRQMARSWYSSLLTCAEKLGLESVDVIYYRNVRNNNADLPEYGYIAGENMSIDTASTINDAVSRLKFEEIFSNYQLFIALTQYSATAPLKLGAKRFGFRAATMPGFTDDMIPALKLDYETINERVMRIKALLDPAIGIKIHFSIDNGKEFESYFDLRFRQAHASGGRFPEKGTAGNLPSGESYIVPYEGELDERSRSRGMLPVQFDDEIVIYEIIENVARCAIGTGEHAQEEHRKLTHEPAYGNIAEIGFGVLSDFGVKPTGSILLDEKLGLHIAFGRSDHFGGAVGIKDFRDPANVVHLDRIYIPETQPRVSVTRAVLEYTDRNDLIIIRDGRYTIF